MVCRGWELPRVPDLKGKLGAVRAALAPDFARVLPLLLSADLILWTSFTPVQGQGAES